MALLPAFFGGGGPRSFFWRRVGFGFLPVEAVPGVFLLAEGRSWFSAGGGRDAARMPDVMVP